jgi:hypothetical protein
MRSPEKIKAPVGGRKWWRRKEENCDDLVDSHYSQKPDHARRSIFHNPRKKSPRRGNYE